MSKVQYVDLTPSVKVLAYFGDYRLVRFAEPTSHYHVDVRYHVYRGATTIAIVPTSREGFEIIERAYVRSL